MPSADWSSAGEPPVEIPIQQKEMSGGDQREMRADEQPEANIRPVQQPQQQHSAFLEQRRWGRRRFCWPILLAIALICLSMFTECHSSPSTPSNPPSSAQIEHAEISANSQAWLEEQRQSAKQAHQYLFQWQKNKRKQKGQGQKGLEEEGEEGRSSLEGRNVPVPSPTASSASPAPNTNIWPLSQYERMLLANALAEHKSLEMEKQQQEGEGESGEAAGGSAPDRPVLIYLPAYSKEKPERTGMPKRRKMAPGPGDELPFQAGGHPTTANKHLAKSSPTSTSSIPFDEAVDEKEEQHLHTRGHNPIRPQSGKGIQQRKRPEINVPRMGQGEKQPNRHFGPYSTDTGGRVPVSSSASSASSRTSRTRPISAENSLITRPSAMFLPAPSRGQQRYLRPIQPVNAAVSAGGGDYGAQQVFLKRIQSAGGQMPAGTEVDQELIGVDRRHSPSASSSPNAALAAINQLFANAGGAGSAAAAGGGQLPPTPLAGTPFDLFSAGSAQPGAQAANGLLSQLPNPLQILSQGTTLEQITTLARNLLQMSNGNQEFLSSLTKVIGGAASADGPASKLTSSAVKVNTRAAGDKTALLGGNGTAETMSAKEAEQIRMLFSSSALGGKSVGELGGGGNGTKVEEDRDETLNSTFALLNNLPLEQRSLLEAALKNGELEPAQAAKFIASEHLATGQGPNDSGANGQRKLVNAESRLMEWIQQNRPRAGHPIESKGEGQKNGGANGTMAKDWLWAMGSAAEKLPYYGRYCGSFVEQANSTRPHGIAGALWAVDERRLLVTKFRFLPMDQSENISFWAGPGNLTGTSADFFPSGNGFHLTPLPLDAQAFNLRPIQKMEAKIRPAHLAANPPDQSVESADANKTSQTPTGPPERDFFDDDIEEGQQLGMDNNKLGKKRAKRNLYNELYGHGQERVEGTSTVPTTASITLGPMSSSGPNNAMAAISPTIVPMHFDGNARSFHLTLGAERKNPSSPPPAMSALPAQASTMEKLSAHQMVSLKEEEAEANHHNPLANLFVNNRWQSLGWHGGIQPLLLTLPEGRLVKMINWLSVWDHNVKQSHAMVLMPTGVSFHVPSTVQLRPLPSAAIGLAGVKKLQSGAIRLLDTKTIEVTEFTLRTDEGLPAWFMVGKEIMPNARGHILPVYDRKIGTFDCNSLREFRNETVTLRLPDPLDIKDVFWFALFSIPRGAPLSHIYIPFNDMQLPPDLLGLQTPQCVWNSPAG